MTEKPTLVVTRGILWGSALVLVVALSCVRLAFWQLQRLDQRRIRNQATTERMRLPAAQLSVIRDDSSGLIFRRTVLNGSYDDERTIIIAGRSLRGIPGVHVLTPLRIGGAAVLVNRGWMPSADAARIELDSIREAGPRGLPALITPFPEDYGKASPHERFRRVWFHMNAARLREQFPYQLLPVVAQILPHAGQPRFPVRLRPPVLDDGPHLGYAIQWFSFAGIAVIGWTVLLLRKRSDART